MPRGPFFCGQIAGLKIGENSVRELSNIVQRAGDQTGYLVQHRLALTARPAIESAPRPPVKGRHHARSSIPVDHRFGPRN
jgi:hypothetical protein